MISEPHSHVRYARRASDINANAAQLIRQGWNPLAALRIAAKNWHGTRRVVIDGENKRAKVK